MMDYAGFDDNFKNKFWCEAISTATKLDNIMVKHMRGKPPYYVFFKEHPNTGNISQFLRDCSGSQS